MKNKLAFLTFILYTVVVGFDILDIGHKQSMLVIHYDNRPDDELLIDNKYIKNKDDIVNIVDKILIQRSIY
jgi:hypothetical protein